MTATVSNPPPWVNFQLLLVDQSAAVSDMPTPCGLASVKFYILCFFSLVCTLPSAIRHFVPAFLTHSAIPGLRKPVVGGNWKCNPESMADLDGLIANINACDTSKCDLYVCPSPLHVAYCCDKIRNGALITPQNCNFKGCGAFTGEMAVEQMKAMGITQVLIGHSERRGEFGIFPMDNNDTLAIKLKYILDAGMSPTLARDKYNIPVRCEGWGAKGGVGGLGCASTRTTSAAGGTTREFPNTRTWGGRHCEWRQEPWRPRWWESCPTWDRTCRGFCGACVTQRGMDAGCWY